MNMKKGILTPGFLAEILEYVESRKTLLDELTIGKRVDVLSKMETQREAEYLQQTRKEERQNIIERMGEDYAKLAGHTAEEDLREPLRKSIGKRLPWLIILLGLGLVVSSVVGAFEQVVALFISIILSSVTGTVIPIIFKKLKVDPAVASGPLITTINDLVAVVTYYGLAWVLLIHVLGL